MSDTVVRTPELSTATILKPMTGFEQKYQGAPVLFNPIAIPGNLDRLAGLPGYDPNLLAGVPVPVGSTALLYIPRVLPVYGSNSPNYVYTFVWRMRAQAEAVADGNLQLSGNLGQRLQGVPEVSGNSPGPRYVLPAAMDTITFTDAEPVSPGTFAGQNIRGLQEEFFGGEWQAPLAPSFPNGSGTNPAAKLNNAGIVSQGLYPDTAISGIGSDYARAGWRGGPNYSAITKPIKGNELIILVTRESGTDTSWDFAGPDAEFSEFYGTNNGQRAPIPNTGIQLYTGSFAS